MSIIFRRDDDHPKQGGTVNNAPANTMILPIDRGQVVEALHQATESK